MASDPKNETRPNGTEPEEVAAKQPIYIEPSNEAEEIEETGPRNRLEEFAARFKKAPESAREQKSGDRLRGAVILGATAVGCLFLFFGLFTTTTDPSKKERKTQPSLGRAAGAATTADAANRSTIPQLNVTQQPNEDTGELTEKDLLGTMRNRGTPIPTENVPKPVKPSKQPARPALNSVDFEDPALAEAYRRQGLTPPPRRTTEVTDWNAAIAEYQAKQNGTKAVPPTPVASVSNTTDALRKSSFVYVRSSLGSVLSSGNAPRGIQQTKPTPLLAQGTKLVARLQNTVSSAAKVPVVAVIEYNYERDGEIIVPAGTKAYGSLSQATPQGWVSLKFDALEFPGGRQEKINGSALSMEQGILKGFVNGTNAGKKFLTRTLTGVGTIAAFALGGRGLGGQVDNSILLRERLSSNVAMGGEQELARLAYQQNIVVTVPANTRFYLVLNEPAVNSSASFPETALPASRSTQSTDVQNGSPLAGMSAQEMQELIAIRNEMREMNRLIKVQNAPAVVPQEPEK